MSTLHSPVPLSDIEAVLAWVDTYKLTRPTKKINRDFSDAVLLAEIMSAHYPKLVEMHNYPPRSSHSLKLNNWMTLNRKVLKKLKLNLCCNTMEQLSNCTPGVIERVLIMVRDKIRRDEELIRNTRDAEQNLSSGGSYYEACGDDDHILMVPVKARVNGVLETIQQKVVSYDSYQNLKVELRDAKDTIDIVKQKVDHLDDLMKIKDERIDELQKQLDRKQSRRKVVEALQNSLTVPFDNVPLPIITDVLPASRKSSLKSIDSCSKIPKPDIHQTKKEESKIPTPKIENPIVKVKSERSITKASENPIITLDDKTVKVELVDTKEIEVVEDRITINVLKDDYKDELKEVLLERKESMKSQGDFTDSEDFKDSEQGITTISEVIHEEIIDIANPERFPPEINYII